MLGARAAGEVDVASRWIRNKPFKGMSVPIGVKAGGNPFYLDMHETGHGPHGLVAGTTGSGKSELLQSIIISLALNYHPHDVVFVLIDYKGGGMADVFKGIPHLVGTITNLGGNETTRALLSIKSELMRRQRVFSEYGVNNIDRYQKLYYSRSRSEQASMPAIPHLIMIADEFAELKQDQPDFMKELVSAARVGRSLGVHLILATQKPAGVVDDQIWSNSKFKICLKVQDETDSKDVIKRPDAAMIKEPGRAYIQVGHDEIFELFQSAYSGADYDPEGELLKRENRAKRITKYRCMAGRSRFIRAKKRKLPKRKCRPNCRRWSIISSRCPARTGSSRSKGRGCRRCRIPSTWTIFTVLRKASGRTSAVGPQAAICSACRSACWTIRGANARRRCTSISPKTAICLCTVLPVREKRIC
ncbi:hypothetical protein HMSSN036_26840 [Paenibacillus macerans]|nr:hypothetical protein HMSSN036_26840 [Paenibacillus macerans]